MLTSTLQNIGSATKCDGIPPSESDCCSSLNLCGVGKGDCDTDSDCKDNLKCGINNCQKDFSVNGSDWNWYDDCCLGMLDTL